MIDTKKLREVAEAATPGPWQVVCTVEQCGGDYLDIIPTEVSCGTWCLGGQPKPPKDKDLSFIAAANPQTIITLLDELDRVTAERDALKVDSERFRWITDDHQDPRVRTDLRDLFDRLPVMSYSAACTAIDAAIRASKEKT